MYPVIFRIGSFTLYAYCLFLVLGILTAILVSRKNARHHNLSPKPIAGIFFIILSSSLMGARLLYVVINFDYYGSNWTDILQFWEGGLVFWGGLLLAVMVTPIYLKHKKLPVLRTADILSPGCALGHAVGRIGCLLAGCCYGKPCNLPIAIKFANPESFAPLGVYLHPTQIYAVLSNLFLFLILLYIQNRKKFHGMVFLGYIMLYSLFRSVIEYFRGDFRGNFFFDCISTSQGISLSMFAVAFFFLISLSKSSRDDCQISSPGTASRQNPRENTPE